MLQVKFLLVGLLLAASFVGYQWLANLPGIPPVRVPEPVVEESADGSALVDSALRSTAARESGDTLAAASAPRPAPLPALNNSDAWLRTRLAAFALPWLAETELVRTSATVLENAARGEIPRKFLQFLAPEGQFAVSNADGRLTTDPTSYSRYDNFVATLLSLPPERAAGMFVRIEPLLAEALRELGGDATGKVVPPRELAYTALGVALATPRSVADTALVRPKVIYEYADEELERLLPLQKQLLRMGPENLQKVRVWLEDFGVALTPGLATEPDSVVEPATTPAASGDL